MAEVKELELEFNDDPQQMEAEFQMRQKVERDLVFHNTVPLEESALPQAREKASIQKGIVLDFFRQRFSMSFTPAEVHSMLIGESIQEGKRELILLTSVRRSISDLTKEGRLIKCQWDESKQGRYGKLNRTWRYQNDFINRLNPKK